MKMSAAPGDVYREAARLVADEGEMYSCCAVDLADVTNRDLFGPIDPPAEMKTTERTGEITA